MDALRIVLLLGLLAVQAAAQKPYAAPAPDAAASAESDGKKPSVNSDDISDCKRIIDALGVSLEGNTVLCPVNKAIANYATAAGYSDVDALLKDAADPNSSGQAEIARIFKGHIIQGFAPKKAIKPGGYATLLSSAEGDSTVVVETFVNGDVKVTSEYAKDLVLVAGADLTFDGPFDGSTTYVVHAIPAVLVPGGGTVGGPSSTAPGGKTDGSASGTSTDGAGAVQQSRGKGFSKSFFIPFASIHSALSSFSSAAGTKTSLFAGFFSKSGQPVAVNVKVEGTRRLLMR